MATVWLSPTSRAATSSTTTGLGTPSLRMPMPAKARSSASRTWSPSGVRMRSTARLVLPGEARDLRELHHQSELTGVSTQRRTMGARLLVASTSEDVSEDHDETAQACCRAGSTRNHFRRHHFLSFCNDALLCREWARSDGLCDRRRYR